MRQRDDAGGRGGTAVDWSCSCAFRRRRFEAGRTAGHTATPTPSLSAVSPSPLSLFPLPSSPSLLSPYPLLSPSTSSLSLSPYSQHRRRTVVAVERGEAAAQERPLGAAVPRQLVGGVGGALVFFYVM